MKFPTPEYAPKAKESTAVREIPGFFKPWTGVEVIVQRMLKYIGSEQVRSRPCSSIPRDVQELDWDRIEAHVVEGLDN